MLFTCPHIQHVAFQSWIEFGPNTTSNIDIPASTWVKHVRRIGANPFQVKTGIVLNIKLAYLACLLKAYENTELMTALLEGKVIMNEYKNYSKKKSQGDMAIAFYRQENWSWYR